MSDKTTTLLTKRENLFTENQIKGYKDNVEIEKGIVLNESYLEENKTDLGDVFSIFTAYPDVFLDLIKPENETINLFFY
jgi:hypothetical protein